MEHYHDNFAAFSWRAPYSEVFKYINYSPYTEVQKSINNYLITESEVFTGKSQTEALPNWPSDGGY